MRMLMKIKGKAAPGRRILSMTLTMALVLAFGMAPVPAYGTQGSDFTVTGGTLDTDYTYDSGGVLTFITPGNYTVSMTNPGTPTTTDKIVVNASGSSEATPVNIILDGVSINVSGTIDACAFDIQSGSTAGFTLGGINALTSGRNKAGLHVPPGAALIIGGDGTLTANGGGGTMFNNEGGAGIGGSTREGGGAVTITGGTVNANGAQYSAGIGGGYYGSGGSVTITGGTVNANGQNGSAGIGGGCYGSGGGTVNISGGTVDATGYNTGIGSGSDGGGSTINISGGNVTAMGISWGAGIGSGPYYTGTDTTVTISGGTVNATAGTHGAGIGGGFRGNGGTIQITGGTVTAQGGKYGAGIGGGRYDNVTPQSYGAYEITISGGTVNATGGDGGAGIGGGFNGKGQDVSGGTINISGGTVTATGGNAVSAGVDGAPTSAGGGAGIGGGCYGSGGTVIITGGKVRADGIQGAGIGGGYDADNDVTGGAVQISGGTVEASSIKGGGGGGCVVYISGGSINTSIISPSALNNYAGGADVYLTAATLADIAAPTAISSLMVSLDGITYNYGTNDMYTDNTGKLYLYLPENTNTSAASTASGNYISTGGGITTANTGTSSGIFCLDVPTPHSGSGGKQYKAEVSGDGTGFISVTIDKSAKNASVDINGQLGGGVAGGGNVTITAPPIPGVTSYTAGIPVAYLSVPGGGTLTFNTNTGSMTLPSNMLAGIPGAEGKKAEITIGQGDKSGLPGGIQAAIGGRPLIRLSLTLDGKQTDWNNPDAPVTVSIPYTPTTEELANPENIVIWYIDGSGNAVCVPNGHYDPATGTVTFDVTHFSDYAVAYNKISFNDVPVGAWYGKAVSFIAARDITTGTGDGKFSPGAELTRGQFLVMLMKAYEIAPDTAGSGNFSDAGDTYYTGYLAAAKRLGISGGVGNNLFTPEKEITRQEMFTLLYNTLKAIGSLPEAGESGSASAGNSLPDFSDADQIASWAREALALLVESGTVSGSSGKLNPAGTTTRAEMAQVLYNLLAN